MDARVNQNRCKDVFLLEHKMFFSAKRLQQRKHTRNTYFRKHMKKVHETSDQQQSDDNLSEDQMRFGGVCDHHHACGEVVLSSLLVVARTYVQSYCRTSVSSELTVPNMGHACIHERRIWG